MTSPEIDAAIQAGNLTAFRTGIATLHRHDQPLAYEKSAQAAIKAHQPEILNECLCAGSVSAGGYSGIDLAFAAARYGDAETIGPLLDRGGLDPCEVPNDHMGDNFFNFCVGFDNLPALKYLLEQRKYTLADFGPFFKEPTNQPFSGAMSRASAGLVAYLLDRGADPNKPPGGLMHLAASADRVDTMRMLRERGFALDEVANPYSNGMQGTPLHHAVDARKIEAVRFLLDEGVDVEARDPAGKDLIERSKYLSREGYEWPELIEELRERGLLQKFGRK